MLLRLTKVFAKVLYHLEMNAKRLRRMQERVKWYTSS